MPAGLPGQHVHLEVVHVHVVGGDAAVGEVVGGGLDCARDELLVLWPLPEPGLLAAVRAKLLLIEGEFLGPDNEDVGGDGSPGLSGFSFLLLEGDCTHNSGYSSTKFVKAKLVFLTAPVSHSSILCLTLVIV